MKTLQTFLYEANNLFPHEHSVDRTFEHQDGRVYDNDILDHHFKGKNVSLSHIASGSYGSAHSVHEKDSGFDTDAHSIVKLSRSDVGETDGYAQHVIGASHSTDRNPHLPRIVKTTQYPTKRGDVHVHEMERLHSIRSYDLIHDNNPRHQDIQSSITYAELGAAHKHAFPNSSRKDSISTMNVVDDVEHAIHSFNRPRDFLKSVNGKALGASPHMMAAAKHVHKVWTDRKAQDRNYGLDIHTGNVMMRRTAVGPQLVITDPVT